jgi:hypothetical protein
MLLGYARSEVGDVRMRHEAKAKSVAKKRGSRSVALPPSQSGGDEWGKSEMADSESARPARVQGGRRIRICHIALAHARVIREPRFRRGAFNPEAEERVVYLHLPFISDRLAQPLGRTCRMSRTLFVGHPAGAGSSSFALKITTCFD